MIGQHKTLHQHEARWLRDHRDVVADSHGYLTAASCASCDQPSWLGRSAIIIAGAHALATGHRVHVTRSQVLELRRGIGWNR